ncbi:hypothetical protein GCM10027040_14520 [Halomonas shantousis]
MQPSDMLRHDDDKTRSPLLNLLILVTLATMVVALWYLADYYIHGSNQDITWYPPNGSCDLMHEACSAELGLHSRLTFGVDGELRPMAPIELSVRLEGIEAQDVFVEFIGRNMNMGLNRFHLEPQDGGVFHGVGQLGICTDNVMPWRAQVVVETSQGRKGSWFDFDLRRRPL